ncbi:MAG: DUF4352 domain-containing protein [Methanophagales archaeon ANME-1-THS]|nr:MAG: DUF4352 domain-containing protein [Methanophagales archaeon ANME-1-THS]
MKSIWKGLIGLFVLLLGFALWLAGSIFEGIAGGLAGESFLLTRGALGIGFLLIFFGPIFFWIFLPLKDRWYESHPKRFIIAITPFVIFLLLIFGVAISGIVHEPQLPEYSFNATLADAKIVVEINRITEGDLPDSLNIKLTDLDGKQADFDYVSNEDLKDGKERVELNFAYFGAPKIGNYTLVIKNIRDEIIYQRSFEITPKVVILGEKIKVGDFLFNFESFRVSDTYKYYKADPGYKFIVIEAKAKNEGIKKQSLNVGEVKLEVDKGYQYEPYSYYSLSFDSLRPEEETTDEIVFEILEDTEPIKLSAEIGNINVVLILE